MCFFKSKYTINFAFFFRLVSFYFFQCYDNVS